MFVDTSVSSRQYFLKVNSTNSEISLDHDLTDQDSITITMKICLDKIPVQKPNIYVQIKTDSNTWEEGLLITTDAINTTQWYTLAFTYDSVTGHLKIFINGVLSATKELSGDLDLNYVPRFGLSSSVECTYAIRELVFYDSALSDSEVLALQSSDFEVTLDMVSAWLFDEGYGITVTDEVASYTGTLSNCSWSESVGVVRLDSINSGILLEHNVTTQTSIAASMWVKLDKTVESFPTIYAQVKTVGSTWETGYLATTTTITPSIWHKLAFSYNNATGLLSIFIDNVLEASKTLSGNLDLSYSPLFGFEGLDGAAYAMRELTIFNSYQTAEVLESLDELYFTPLSGILSLWLFSEGYGNHTYDSIASYEGTLINCSWESLQALRIYPTIERILNLTTDSVIVKDASSFDTGNTVYLVNPDTGEYEVNSISDIETNIITLSSTLSTTDKNLILVDSYNIPIYPELSVISSNYVFDLFNYYKISNPEIFIAITSDTPRSVTLTPANIKYKTTDMLYKDVDSDFTVFRLELQDGGNLQPYYMPVNLYLSFDTKNNYYSLYLGEGTDLVTIHDVSFTSVRLEQWINIRTANASEVYLYGQLETVNSSFDDSYLESTTPLSLNTWYHIGLVYDETEGILKLYIDGILDCEKELTGQINDVKPICLGIAGTDVYTAVHDELKVWNVGTEITTTTEKLLGHEEGLVYYYTFDEGQSTNIIDVSKNEYDGTIYGDDYLWETSVIPMVNPYYSDVIDIQYINKMLRDRFVLTPKIVVSAEYLKLYNTINTMIVPLDQYENVVDSLTLYDYDKHVLSSPEISFMNNIKLYKFNHTTEDTIVLATTIINDVIYRATIINTDGTNIIDSISKYRDKLLAFVYSSGIIYLYVPSYFRDEVDSITIYEV